jgi:hypothetical protein
MKILIIFSNNSFTLSFHSLSIMFGISDVKQIVKAINTIESTGFDDDTIGWSSPIKEYSLQSKNQTNQVSKKQPLQPRKQRSQQQDQSKKSQYKENPPPNQFSTSLIQSTEENVQIEMQVLFDQLVDQARLDLERQFAQQRRENVEKINFTNRNEEKHLEEKLTSETFSIAKQSLQNMLQIIPSSFSSSSASNGENVPKKEEQQHFSHTFEEIKYQQQNELRTHFQQVSFSNMIQQLISQSLNQFDPIILQEYREEIIELLGFIVWLELKENANNIQKIDQYIQIQQQLLQKLT